MQDEPVIADMARSGNDDRGAAATPRRR